jgi:Holliday junction resolvasome RuvABC DNA-binding subunit
VSGATTISGIGNALALALPSNLTLQDLSFNADGGDGDGSG